MPWVDTTLSGVGDNGILFADDAFYAKPLMGPSECVRYENIYRAKPKLNGIAIQDDAGDEFARIDVAEAKPKAVADVLNTIALSQDEKRACMEGVRGNPSIVDFNELCGMLKALGFSTLGLTCWTGTFWRSRIL